MNDEEQSVKVAGQVKPDEHHVSAKDIKHVLADSLFISRFKGYMFTFLAIVIALGEYSEAVQLIGDGVDSLMSEFTHDVEYEQLSKINVGNTANYAESVLGEPKVSRAIGDDLTANYFYSDKYLVTLFYNDRRIEAYTVVSLIEDFHPAVFGGAQASWLLGVEPYNTFPTLPKVYLIDHSITTSFYIERLDKGRAGLFSYSFLGNVPFGASFDSSSIVKLYEQEVHGSEEEVLEAQEMLRVSMKPNFFGEGELTMAQIQKSLLTAAEFQNYFGE